jgi:hypothetical protein
VRSLSSWGADHFDAISGVKAFPPGLAVRRRAPINEPALFHDQDLVANVGKRVRRRLRTGCEQAANRLPPSRGDVEFAVPRPPSLLDRRFPPRGGRGI